MTMVGRMLAARPQVGWPLVVAGAAVLVILLSTPAILLRPAGVEGAIWWPAAGVAVGVALRTPRRHMMALLVAFTMSFVLAQAAAGRPLALAVGLGVAAGVEAFVATRILCGPTRRVRQLSRIGDVLALGLAAVAGGASYAVLSTVTIALVDSPANVQEYLEATVLAHVIGVLLVTPLFFSLGRGWTRGRTREILTQSVSLVGLLALVVWSGDRNVPIAFAILGPLVWGAARFGGRIVLIQFLIVMFIASLDRAEGLVASSEVDAGLAVFVTQAFVLSYGIVVVAVLAVSASQRRLLRLSTSAINASLTGFAELRDRGGTFTLHAQNDAARLVVGGDDRALQTVFDNEGVEAVVALAGQTTEEAESLGGTDRVTTLTGRVLQVAISPLLDQDSGGSDGVLRRFSLQFVDVTDSIAIAQAEEDDRQRAAEMQRALLPDRPPAGLIGWQLAGACRPSREVGGDFYSWKLSGNQLAITLGDVMGKGLGAGVMAASLQTAARLTNNGCAPSVVLAQSAAAVREQLERASTFATVVQAHVDVTTGRVQYADAGHGLTIIVRADGSYTRLGSVNLPLGLDDEEELADAEAMIESGEIFVSLSDGALDAFPDSVDPLADVAALIAGTSTAEAAVEATITLSTLPGIADDITVVALLRE